MIPKKFFYIFFSCLLSLISCGGGDSFTITGEIEGLGTQNLNVVYRVNDKYNHLTTAALDSKFSFVGSSDKPVIIDIYTKNYAPIGSVVARNGETVEVKFKLNEPGYMQAKGDAVSERLARFITDNSDAINTNNFASVNAAVAAYVSRNPKDLASAYILTSLFDSVENPHLADSVASLLDPNVVNESGVITTYADLLSVANDSLPIFPSLVLYTSGDSTTTIAPGASKGVFLAIYDNNALESYQASIDSLNGLQNAYQNSLRVVELSLVTDTTTWHNQLGQTKQTFTRCWEPGSVSAPSLTPFNIRRLPWYILADSTGTVRYSGAIYDDAVRAIKH